MKTTILLGIVALCPLATWAADDNKPFDAKLGLWETAVSMNMAGMPAMPAMPQIPAEALANMPPAQRAQIEAMMKGRGGAGGPQITTKVCLTRASLDAGALGQSDKSCTSKVVSSTASKQVIHVECAQEKSKTTGDLTLERVDAEHAKGTMAMKQSEGGQTRDVTMAFDTKWISADCGDVKPVGGK